MLENTGRDSSQGESMAAAFGVTEPAIELPTQGETSQHIPEENAQNHDQESATQNDEVATMQEDEATSTKDEGTEEEDTHVESNTVTSKKHKQVIRHYRAPVPGIREREYN